MALWIRYKDKQQKKETKNNRNQRRFLEKVY